MTAPNHPARTQDGRALPTTAVSGDAVAIDVLSRLARCNLSSVFRVFAAAHALAEYLASRGDYPSKDAAMIAIMDFYNTPTDNPFRVPATKASQRRIQGCAALTRLVHAYPEVEEYLRYLPPEAGTRTGGT